MSENMNMPYKFIETLMPKMSANAWKVFCFIWVKAEMCDDPAIKFTYDEIAEAAGIEDCDTVKESIKEIREFIGVSQSVEIDTLTLKFNAYSSL
jgi:hypothetical protein